MEINFKVPVAPGKAIDRVVYSYVILDETITLIDSGVAGSEVAIFDLIRQQGRSPEEIKTLLLTHAHPDHLGAARTIKEATDCRVFCHAADRAWAEDAELHKRERPVPGFELLVSGSVKVDELLQEGDELEIGADLKCRVLHTPGHSAGSVSFLFEKDHVLFSGDALPLPGDFPIYDDQATSVASVHKLQQLEGVQHLLSNFEAPITGSEAIRARMAAGLEYLDRIRETVLRQHAKSSERGMELCKQVVGELGLPPMVANPLLVKAFDSNLPTDPG